MGRKGGEYRCAYLNCNNRTGQGSNISFFRFPKDVNRSSSWVNACGKEELKSLTSQDLYNKHRICQEHFDERHFLNDLKNRLHDFACPRAYTSSCNLESQQKTIATESNFVHNQSELDVSSNCEGHEDDNVNNIENDVSNPCIDHDYTFTFNSTTQASSAANINSSEQRTVNNDFSLLLSPTSRTKATQTESSLSNNTPRKLNLRKKVNSLRKQVERLRKTKVTKIKKKDALQIDDVVLTRDQIHRLIESLLPQESAEFVKAQIININRKPQGKRYDKQFKQFCLNLYYAGPKTYKKLRKSFQLVSVKALQRLTRQVDFRPGVRRATFDTLKLKVDNLNESDKFCTLCIDEMSLKAFLNYDQKRDEVVGLEDMGQGKKMKPACSAMVGMLRGIANSWKQPLCYYLVYTQCSFNNVRNLIIECITIAKEVGLKIVAVVSDMGMNFMQLSESLGISTNNSVFSINGENYYYIYDVPHLIKATRNNLMNNHCLIGDQFTSWKYIETVYDIGKDSQNPPAPKLTENHIHPTNFARMKVKFATQVISKTVASSIEFLVDKEALPREALATSAFIRKFDDLFDMLNSSSLNSSKEHKKAFVGSEFQVRFLEGMKQLIQQLEVYKISNNNLKNLTNSVSFLKGWIITINSIIGLWNDLRIAGFDYLYTRRLNQDALECFFGEIRTSSGNALNPTPLQFVYAFKKLFFINYTNMGTGNCMEDCDNVLLGFDHLGDNAIHAIEFFDENENQNQNLFRDFAFNDFQNVDIVKITEANVFTYICGYLVKKCLKIHTCDICESYANAGRTLNERTLYSHYRAYDKTENDPFGKLYVPSDDFVAFGKNLEDLFFERFYNFFPNPKVIHSVYELFLEVPFNHPCDFFPYDFLIKLFARVRFFFTLKFINRHFKTQKGHAKYIILSHN